MAIEPTDDDLPLPQTKVAEPLLTPPLTGEQPLTVLGQQSGDGPTSAKDQPPKSGDGSSATEAASDVRNHSVSEPPRLRHPTYILALIAIVLAIVLSIIRRTPTLDSLSFVIDSGAAFVGAAEASYQSAAEASRRGIGKAGKLRKPTKTDMIVTSAFLAGFFAILLHIFG